MSIKPLTERQQTLIVNNVVKATKDISKLNKIGYKFINLASGFIAHYNLYGFIDYYMNHDLEEDILRNKNANMWDNFRPGDNSYEYYMTKRNVYQRICEILENE
jgi:hypothetical protein